jgi:3'-phosphoadenosine 5'-phosphosulfate sulfotransferase (PAPS reductase)/FAD synthetase
MTDSATMKDALATIHDGKTRHIVAVSGGKDSAALAVYMKQRYPELPVEYVFCDTECELPETYEYIEKMEDLLGKRIVRLTAIYENQAAKKNRNPFEFWLNEQYGGFLPSPRSRWCTRVLKIEPYERYIGTDQAFSYIGIRADEDRDGYIAKKPPKISELPNIRAIYPFKEDGLGILEIRRVLEESGLGLPDYYKWRSRSGCYFCFYQQKGEWQRLKEEHPDLFEKAKSYERVEGEKLFSWVDGKTLDQIADDPKRFPLPQLDEGDGCAVCHI